MPRQSFDSEYRHALLPQEDVEIAAEKDAIPSHQARSPSKLINSLWGALLASSVFLNVFLIWSVRGRVQHAATASCPDESYSPAWDAVEYEQRLFSKATAVPLPWQGAPSDEVDAAWEDLIDSQGTKVGLTKIPKADAAKMLNHTVAVPGDEGSFATTLDVFHQLHCLNLIRKALHPDYYADHLAMHNSGAQGFNHVGHCITAIRESLMCSADITPTVFKWEETEHRTFPRLDVMHTCRNFDKIRDWAKERHLEDFDLEVHVADDLKIPIIH
ncbi:hypothetical protein HWV62_24087 [Athelia sp. TMB]|nr:hypothetical protein HWV62_24087 [Athelia sp. TMB]